MSTSLDVITELIKYLKANGLEGNIYKFKAPTDVVGKHFVINTIGRQRDQGSGRALLNLNCRTPKINSGQVDTSELKVQYDLISGVIGKEGYFGELHGIARLYMTIEAEPVFFDDDDWYTMNIRISTIYNN